MLITISNKELNSEEWIDLKDCLMNNGYHACLRDTGNYDTVFEITERRITEEVPPFEPEAEVNVNPTTKKENEIMCAMLLNPFDASQVDPSTAVQKFPIGTHKVVIVGNAIEATKDNSGGMLDLTLQIIEGEFAGMQDHWRLGLYLKQDTDNGKKAVEIAYKNLSALCHVTGIFQVNNADVLMNIPFQVVVGLQKKKHADDPDYTEIKGVKDINGNDPGKGQAPQQQQQQQQQPVQQFQQPQQQQPMQQQGNGWNQGQQQPVQQQPVQQQPANNGWNQQQQQQQPVQQQQPQGGGWQQQGQQQQAAGGPSWAQNK